MQFKNNKNNDKNYVNNKFVSFVYQPEQTKPKTNAQPKEKDKKEILKYGPIEYFKISIGKKYDPKQNPIEIALNKAEEFIYIISPYINENTMDLLVQKTKQNIDVKLICTYRTETSGEIKNYELKSFQKLISDKLDYSDFDRESTNKKIEYSNRITEYNRKEKDINKSLLISYFLIFLSPIILGLLYYFNKFSKFTLIPLGFIFIASITSVLNFKAQLNKNRYERDILGNKLADELKKLQEKIPPNIFFNFEPLITKNTYNSDYSAAVIHTKLYIMDYKTENYSGVKAFLGSANFTDAGLHYNHEFLFETTDNNFTKELKNYFNSFYKSFIEDPELSNKILTKEEIRSELFKRGFIKYPENYFGKNLNE